MKTNPIVPVVFLSLCVIFFSNSCKKEPPKVVPTLTTNQVSSIASTTAICGGSITSDGGSAITVRGVCWSTNQTPTTTDSISSDGSGTGSFNSSITGLIPGVKYYVRAYATNSIGTAYGTQLTFNAIAIVPTITTIAITTITATTASSGGNILNDGGAPIIAKGVCWDITQNPTILNAKTTNGTGIGIFTSSIVGLNPGTTYYFRAYATNNAGTSYGNQVIGTTNAVLPTISTTSVSNITETTLTSGGAITYDGGSAVTARGVCWSTAQNPTIIDSKTNNGTGSSSFESIIKGLSHNTIYYIRAYATNSMGTSYGNQIEVKTVYNPWHPHLPVQINGTTWAPVNIGFELTNFYGLLFQWGRKYGQNYNSDSSFNMPGPISLSEGNNISNASYFFYYSPAPHDWCTPQVSSWSMTLYNPCPNGWRMPTKNELESLINLGSTWEATSAYGNISGKWFGNDHSRERISSIFLPTAGYKSYNTGFPSSLTSRGSYWTMSNENLYVYGLVFTIDETIINTFSRANGFSVRCVKD